MTSNDALTLLKFHVLARALPDGESLGVGGPAATPLMFATQKSVSRGIDDVCLVGVRDSNSAAV